MHCFENCRYFTINDYTCINFLSNKALTFSSNTKDLIPEEMRKLSFGSKARVTDRLKKSFSPPHNLHKDQCWDIQINLYFIEKRSPQRGIIVNQWLCVSVYDHQIIILYLWSVAVLLHLHLFKDVFTSR